MIVSNLLSRNAVSPSVLYLIRMPGTKSNIIQQNNGELYCAKYPHLKGLFRKDIDETREFGRKFCDDVADKMGNMGFFTSDERPEYGVSYGIRENEYDFILNEISADPEHHLVVMFAYPERESLETKTVIERKLRELYIENNLV